MQYYWIDPLAPLVFRSGKPFGSQSDTEDIIFPLPSAAAGLLRSTWARQQDDFSGQFNASALQNIATHGLFLAQKDAFSGSLKLFAPKPADCLYLKNKETGQTELVRLLPHTHFVPNEEGGSDLPKHLLPIQMESRKRHIKGKPQGGKPFWLLSDYFAWLNGEDISFEQVHQNGIALPTPDVRTHVAMDSQTQTGKDGLLFQTAAYDFAPAQKNHHQGWQNESLGFVIAGECDLENDLVRFGGEGRLSRLEKTCLSENNTPFRQPEISGNTIKLTLLTPAIFKNGYLPQWLEKDLTGTLPNTNLNVKLRAVAVERWQPVSGWDLAAGQPKAMRKAVPAGSVYWFEILNKTVDFKSALATIQSICDEEQDQRDGFGMVAISEWKDETK